MLPKKQIDQSARLRPKKRVSQPETAGPSRSLSDYPSPFQKPVTNGPNTDQTEFKCGVWFVKGSLRVTFGKQPSDWNTVERILECILDKYDGNEVFKPLVLAIYWLMSYNLKQMEGPSNRHTVGVNFEEVIKINHKIGLLEKQSIIHDMDENGVYRGISYCILFHCELVPSRRKSVDYLTLARERPAQGSPSKDFLEILNDVGVLYDLINGQLVLKSD